MTSKQRLDRIKSLWCQYGEAKSKYPQASGGIFRALDKAINPHAYKDDVPVVFNVGDKIKISFTVIKSILNGKRRHQRKTVIKYGRVVADMPGDEKWKDGRIRIEFDEKEKHYCPVCGQHVSSRLGFRCLPDDLQKVKSKDRRQNG